MNAPCRHCEARKLGCHADCERYRAWKRGIKRERDGGEADAFLAEMCRARKRRWNRRPGK